MHPKAAARHKRKQRIRKKSAGVDRLRLSVFRSAKHIYVQIIDDGQGRTLAAASTLSGELQEQLNSLKKVDAAKAVGKLLAAKAKAQGIDRVFFDRNGFLYHGRVKAVAEGCRENGLEF
ncbi:MAG: 50S ribosomal protein L18 [Deltaproteobacteria bacterium]|jgi:large subunit ribosomal protein L18